MEKRLQKELQALLKDPPNGVKVDAQSIYKNLSEWIVDLDGAPGTLYEGEKFQLAFKFGSRYPFDSPQVMFIGGNIPLHPHVYSNGHICLSILTDDWSPALSVQSVCLSVVSMLSSCKEKKRPPDDSFYVKTCSKNPKKTRWWYHDHRMPRKKSWKKAAVKKNACKADVGDKYPTDVGHVQLSVPLGVGHVLTPMTSVPAGVISTTPVTVVSAALPETTLTQTMPLAQTMPQMLPLAQTMPQMLPLAQTMPQMLPLAQTMPQMLPLAQKLPQMIYRNSSQFLTQNISQITTQNITPFTMNNIPNETTHALQGNCMHQNSDNLVFGSFHQGSMRFSSFSRGNQCTCNSLMMLSNSYENFSFTSSFLDQTLLKGDNLYNTVVKNLQSAGKLKSRLLMFDELPIHIDSGENHHMVDKFDTLFGLIVTDDKRNQIQTLHECLQQALGLSRYVLIMIGSICSALYKDSDNDFYFFDSHSHGENGLSECDGKSLMRHSCCLDDLLGFLYAMYESMHIEFATEFEVMPVAFRTLIHSFPSNNQSTHKYCRLDQLTTTALTNKQSADTNTGHLKTTAIKKDKKDYMREYMRNKRQDPEFKDKERDSMRNKRQDPEFKSRERDSKRNKRQDSEFKDNERDCMRNKRQDAEFKEKERDSKRNKRQDPEFKDKERDSMRKKRQDAEFKGKETESKRNKRQDPEFKSRERDSKRNKRQDPEFKDNERDRMRKKRQHAEFKEKDRDSKRNKRQDTEFKSKERDSKRNKRQDPEFKEKERDSKRNKRQVPEFKDNERDCMRKKRQDAEFKEKERDSKRNKRQDPEFKSRERDSKRNKRQDPEFKSRERDSKRYKRQDAEFKDKERDSKRYKRQEEEYRHNEQIRDLKKKKEMRQNSSQLEKERLKMKEKRKNEEYRSSENIAAKQSKAHSRGNLDYIESEKQRYRKSKFGVDAIECVDNFHNNVRLGPVFVCTCCQQTWFHESVSNVDNVLLDAEIKRKYFTNTKSVNGQEWICNTCNLSLKESRTPKLSVANGMIWIQKPSELNLLPLEERLVSLRIPFMQIRELPRGGQYSVKGNVVNVPVDIQPTINSLPRRLDENITIPVKLKRKLSFQHSYCHENIRPTKVLIALHWLSKNSEYYQNSNINIDDNWFHEVTNSASELMREFVEGYTNEDSAMHDQSDESDSDEFCEVDSSKDGNHDTLLDSDSYDMNQIFTFAPGEGQRPISLYQDQMAEYLSFPTIFCGKGRVENDQRQVPVSYADIAKWELRSVDRRAAQSVPNLFFKLKKIQLKQVTDKCNLALRKCKTKGKTFTANEIRNPDQVNDIVRHNEGFYVFKQLRNSPPYLETRKKDVFAMIRQLGLPTWFMSFSAADTRWNDLIRALGVLNDDKQYTDSEIESMTWTEKSKLVQKDPITCTRYFDHRFRTFLNTVLKSDHHPIGKIQDFFYRVEFQQRGSPHVHMIVWIENAPKYLENDNKEIVAFVDSYLKCERNTEDNLIELQVHKHSQTCKKKGKAVCRFGFPLPPLQATMILEPLESDIEKYKKMHKTMQDKVNDFKNGCDISCTFQDFLQNVLQLSEDDYIKCIRSSLRTPKVFLKRKPCDLRVNAYNSTLLHAWAANIDIQYVLDPYACAMYIVSYISKSQRGMSDLLSRAAKEAREGNLDIKRQVRHIGNQFLNSVEVGAQEAAYLVLQMPLTKASRDVMFINTSPVDDRVILVKPDSELEKLNANSTDIECSNIVKRYAKRPKQLENWCLADYVSQLDVVFPKESITELSEMETNDDERHQSENEDSGTDIEDEFKDDSTLVVLRNGIKIKRRKTPRVIRYVRYSLKTSPENYYREKLMLFTPWRNECSDLLCGHQSFEQSFNQIKFFLAQKIKQYEHNADMLEQAEQMVQDDLTEAYDELAPGAQQTDADDEYEGNVDSETFVHFNPERPIEQREYDIGSDVGIPSTRQLNEQSSVRLPDDEYLKLVASLNLKQREFFNHVMQWIKSKQEPIHAYLSGGAGVGKSVLIRALYQALHRYLCAKEGENPDDIRILLCAYTGKAAFNIGGQTIASAFHQKINQRQQNMHCDELNTFRTKYRNLSVVIIDEISMVGNAKLEFINDRLQLLTGLKRPFGDISIIAVGDFFQLKPIMDGWIFQDLKQNAQALACNLWKENFTLFELDEVMRQKDDLEFAQLLNRLRHNEMTSEDLDIIHKCIIAENSPNYPHNAPHLFTMNAKVDEYNNKLIEQLPGEKVIVKAVDSVLQDHSKSVKDRLLRSLQNQDDVSKTANLMTRLTLAIGMIYDITVNIDVTDGLTNGSSCTVFLVENRLPGVSRPSIVWVKFLDSAVGRIARQKYRHLFHDDVMDDWTPIFDCQRSFVFNSTTYQRIQFPLRPAAGKTIHKAQGCTVDEIVVDLSQTRTRKTPHIHYVALSRVRSVDKLHILNFNEQALTIDEKVVEEMERMRKDAPLKLCYLPLYKTEQNKLKIMFNNARSLHKHFDEIKNEPNVVASDVIGFSETRLTINDEQNFMMEGYLTLFNHEKRSDSNRPHHGTALYVKQDHLMACISKFSNTLLEFIIALINFRDLGEVQIVVLYKFPACSFKEFEREVMLHLKPFVDTEKKLIILGDFNFDLFTGHKEFLNFMKLNLNCTQLVKKLTHDSGSQLDLIFTNFPHCETDVIEAYWSDHKMVYCTYTL